MVTRVNDFELFFPPIDIQQALIQHTQRPCRLVTLETKALQSQDSRQTYIYIAKCNKIPGTCAVYSCVWRLGCFPGAWRRGSWHFEVASLHLQSIMNRCPLHTIFPSYARVAGGVCRPRSETPCNMIHMPIRPASFPWIMWDPNGGARAPQKVESRAISLILTLRDGGVGLQTTTSSFGRNQSRDIDRASLRETRYHTAQRTRDATAHTMTHTQNGQHHCHNDNCTRKQCAAARDRGDGAISTPESFASCQAHIRTHHEPGGASPSAGPSPACARPSLAPSAHRMSGEPRSP